MSLDALRKTIFDANGSCRILLDIFTVNQFTQMMVVEYDCKKLKHNDDVRKMFFIYLEFSAKGLIEFNVTFGHSPNKIFALLHKPRKPRIAYEIFALMHNEFV